MEVSGGAVRARKRERQRRALSRFVRAQASSRTYRRRLPARESGGGNRPNGGAGEGGFPGGRGTGVLPTLAEVGAGRGDGGGWTVGPSIAALARGIEPPL